MRWLVLLALLAGWTPDRGRAVYDRHCLPCHGVRGDGRGPAATYTSRTPRSFVRGVYKWRSTPVGQPPLVDDLRRTIALGAPGTSMPGFAGVLAPDDIDAVIAVLRDFAPFDGIAQPIVLGAPPPPDPERGDALWTKLCRACHGTGNGDGMTAFALSVKPYPFARVPFHRPREPGSLRTAIATSIATGIAGTPMQSYAKQLPEADIWALADHVVAINARAAATGDLAEPIAADREVPLPIGAWPGAGDGDESIVFGASIELQGTPPVALAPAQASLAAEQCARCHAKQLRDWSGSRHAGATSPGFRAQTEFGMAAAARTTCLRCHAPLAEQAGDASLRAEGVGCAGCHVRGWTRHGPPNVASSLLPLPSYPLVTTDFYDRADFCLPCHQLPPRDAVAGKPLLDTYREWLEGPYMRRGVGCQQCHMPDREHQMRGIHDPHTVRQGIRLVATAHRKDGAITVVAELTNAGAGHALPTTPAPALVLAVELVDAGGRTIASDALRIGRDVRFDGSWHELADTRIAPGATATLARAWRTDAAARARVRIEVHPDAYYERIYADAVATVRDPAQRALYAQALDAARRSRYTLEERGVTISDPSRAV